MIHALLIKSSSASSLKNHYLVALCAFFDSHCFPFLLQHELTQQHLNFEFESSYIINSSSVVCSGILGHAEFESAAKSCDG